MLDSKQGEEQQQRWRTQFVECSSVLLFDCVACLCVLASATSSMSLCIYAAAAVVLRNALIQHIAQAIKSSEAIFEIFFTELVKSNSIML